LKKANSHGVIWSIFFPDICIEIARFSVTAPKIVIADVQFFAEKLFPNRRQEWAPQKVINKARSILNMFEAA
jgi:hypothetical protein